MNNDIRKLWDKWVDGIPTPTKRKVLTEICRSIHIDVVSNMDEIKTWLKQVPLEEILKELMEGKNEKIN